MNTLTEWFNENKDKIPLEEQGSYERRFLSMTVQEIAVLDTKLNLPVIMRLLFRERERAERIKSYMSGS